MTLSPDEQNVLAELGQEIGTSVRIAAVKQVRIQRGLNMAAEEYLQARARLSAASAALDEPRQRLQQALNEFYEAVTQERLPLAGAARARLATRRYGRV